MTNGFDIRVLAASGIEDHHAHLLRLDYLDRCLFFATGNDDRAVDAHCLRLMASQAIVIGAYDEGRLRASVEIIPDRAGARAAGDPHRRARFPDRRCSREVLMRRARDEAQKHGFDRLDFVGMTGVAAATRCRHFADARGSA